VGAHTQHVIPSAVFDEVIVVARDVTTTGHDLFYVQHVVKHPARIWIHIAYDMGVAAAVDGFRKCPGLDPGLQFRQAHQGQESEIGAASLHRVQQDLPFEIGSEYVPFPVSEILEVLGIAHDIDLLGTPEESQLFVSELVKLSILQGVIALHAHTAQGIQERQAPGVISILA